MRHQFRFVAVSVFVLALLCIAIACSSSKVGEYPGLTNEGILPVSDTDPFLGANLFLARELEQSTYLYNFFVTRGAPTAIEIKKERMEPAEMLLYYGQQQAAYVGQLDNREAGRQWIIRGPYTIKWKDASTIQRLQQALKSEPVFKISGRQRRFYPAGREKPHTILVPILPPTPVPTPVKVVKRPKRTTKKTPAARKPSEPKIDPNDWSKLNTDQRALLISKGYAERTVSGDVIHTVKRENETVAQIAKWYTGSASHAKEIAKNNHVEVDQPLNQGMRVQIPARLNKKKKAMPANFR